MHALALMGGAVARDGEGSVRRRAAGFNRHDAGRKRACQRELRDLAGGAMAGNRDLPPSGEPVLPTLPPAVPATVIATMYA